MRQASRYPDLGLQLLSIGKRPIVVDRFVGMREWPGAEPRSGGAEARDAGNVAPRAGARERRLATPDRLSSAQKHGELIVGPSCLADRREDVVRIPRQSG